MFSRDAVTHTMELDESTKLSPETLVECSELAVRIISFRDFVTSLRSSDQSLPKKFRVSPPFLASDSPDAYHGRRGLPPSPFPYLGPFLLLLPFRYKIILGTGSRPVVTAKIPADIPATSSCSSSSLTTIYLCVWNFLSRRR